MPMYLSREGGRHIFSRMKASVVSLPGNDREVKVVAVQVDDHILAIAPDEIDDLVDLLVRMRAKLRDVIVEDELRRDAEDN